MVAAMEIAILVWLRTLDAQIKMVEFNERRHFSCSTSVQLPLNGVDET